MKTKGTLLRKARFLWSPHTRQYYSSEGMSLCVTAANWADAASPIYMVWVEAGEPTPTRDDEWRITPYQVADARHSRRRALDIVREWSRCNA